MDAPPLGATESWRGSAASTARLGTCWRLRIAALFVVVLLVARCSDAALCSGLVRARSGHPIDLAALTVVLPATPSVVSTLTPEQHTNVSAVYSLCQEAPLCTESDALHCAVNSSVCADLTARNVREYALLFRTDACGRPNAFELLPVVLPPSEFPSRVPNSVEVVLRYDGYALVTHDKNCTLDVALECRQSVVQHALADVELFMESDEDDGAILYVRSAAFCSPTQSAALPVTHTRDVTPSRRLTPSRYGGRGSSSWTREASKSARVTPSRRKLSITATHILSISRNDLTPTHDNRLSSTQTRSLSPQTPSRTPPPKATPTASASGNVSATRSPPVTPTMPLTLSPAVTLSRNVSLSHSNGVTESRAVTRTANVSGTRSKAVTTSPAVTRSVNVSGTRSKAVTTSPAVTRTANLSTTNSRGITASPIPSQTNSSSVTSSLVATQSPPPSTSFTVSLSSRVTPSRSLEATRSGVLSRSLLTATSSATLSDLTPSDVATPTATRSPTRSLSATRLLSPSPSLVPTPTRSVSDATTVSATTNMTTSATLLASVSTSLVPPTIVTLNISATVALGQAVPLPILQRVSLELQATASSALLAIAGLAVTRLPTASSESMVRAFSEAAVNSGDGEDEEAHDDEVPDTATSTNYPPFEERSINIVSVLSLAPETRPAYQPEAYNDTLSVAVCVMVAQANAAVPYVVHLVTTTLNTTTGQLADVVQGGSGATTTTLTDIKMPVEVPLDNVGMTYGGYALYQLVLANNPQLVLLVRPTTLVFVDATQAIATSQPLAAVYNIDPTIYGLQPLPFTTITRLVVMEAVNDGFYVLLYTRGGTDICAVAISAGDPSNNTLSFDVQQVPVVDPNAPTDQGCIHVGDADSSDYLNAVVSDYDAGATEDGWIATADHKTVLVSPNASMLPTFVFRTSLRCTLLAVQLVQNNASDVTDLYLLAGGRTSFTGCSTTPPVVLSSRIFAPTGAPPLEPSPTASFPLALMVWSGALSLVNTTSGRIMATILAPGNASDQTLLLPFWIPPVDEGGSAPTPTPSPPAAGGDGTLRLPFLMVRNDLLELVQLEATSPGQPNMTVTLVKLVTEDIQSTVLSVALVPPFAAGMQSARFEALGLVSIKPNRVVTVLLKPSVEVHNLSTHTSMHYRQFLDLPSFETDYVLSVERWKRRATSNRNAAVDDFAGNCSFYTNLVPTSTDEVLVHGEVFQINTLRMAFLVCIDAQYGIVDAISAMSASPSGINGGVLRFTTPTYILSAHKHEVTVVGLGASFFGAMTRNGSAVGVAWYQGMDGLVYQDASLVSPRRAKAGNDTNPIPSAGLALNRDCFLVLRNKFDDDGATQGPTELVALSLLDGGRPAWRHPLMVTCNETTSFLATSADNTSSHSVGCLHTFRSVSGSGDELAIVELTVFSILWDTDASDTSVCQRVPTVVAGATTSIAVHNASAHSTNLIVFSIAACASLHQSSGSAGGSTSTGSASYGEPTACRIVLAMRSVDLMFIDPPTRALPHAQVAFVSNTSALVDTAVGMQVSKRGMKAYLLAKTGITTFSVFDAVLLWTSKTASVCAPAVRLADTIPSNTPCHIAVDDELCEYGGACVVLLIGYDDDGIANIMGFNSTESDGAPLWRFVPQNSSVSNNEVLLLAQLLAPTMMQNSKLFVFSAYNLSVNCYSVRDTGSAPVLLWSSAVSGSTLSSDAFLQAIVQNATGQRRNPCFGLLRVSDFGTVVAVLRCSLPFYESGTSIPRIATYSVAIGLDSFTGALLWTVEPLTYNVLTVTEAGVKILHQPRSFLSDEDRGYAMWNSTVFVAQLASSPYFPIPPSAAASSSSANWFHSQVEEERVVVGINLLTGDVLFELPIARPSNLSTEREYGSHNSIGPNHIPGSIPSPSALLLTLVPNAPILMLNEFASRTLWATDVSIFPLGQLISDVHAFYTSRLPSLEAFYFFGTLEDLPNGPSGWRPSTPLDMWDCVATHPFDALGPLAVAASVNMTSCTATQQNSLTGILNWSALPKALDPQWRQHALQRNTPFLASIAQLTARQSALRGRFAFGFLSGTSMEVLDVAGSQLFGVLESFEGLPPTMQRVDISDQLFLYAGGSDFSGMGSSQLLTSGDGSLVFLKEATALAHLDLSNNLLATSILPEFFAYVPPSLQHLNLSNAHLFGALFEFADPIVNASSDGHGVRSRGVAASAPAVPLRLEVLDISHNRLFLGPASRFLDCYCNELYPAALTTLLAGDNDLAGPNPPLLYAINTSDPTTVPTQEVACRMAVVDLSQNNVSGHLNLSEIAPSLTLLNLSFNGLRDVIDLTEMPAHWRSNLTTLDVTGNPLLTGVVSPVCPPKVFTLFDTALPCTPNNGSQGEVLGTGALCSNDARRSSMIYPYVDLITNVIDPTRLMMVYTQVHNASIDPAAQAILNCSFDAARLLRFKDGRIGFLDAFVDETAACLPRGIVVVEGLIELSTAVGPPPTVPAGGGSLPPPTIVNVALRCIDAASNTSLATAASTTPPPGTPLHWVNYTNSSCQYLNGSFCLIDTDGIPFKLFASVAAGVTIEEIGGYTTDVQSTLTCISNLTSAVVLPTAIGGTNLFPQYILQNLTSCLPKEYGIFRAALLTSSSQIEFVDSTPVPVQFSTQLCDRLPTPANCPSLPRFKTPATLADARAAQTCVDGFCADTQTIMWEACGTSIWNYDGFKAVGECHPLSDILRLPMATERDPTVAPCVYDNTPATCGQVTGRWTSLAVDLFLQAIQPDLVNNSLLPIYQPNCLQNPPQCSAPSNQTLVDNMTDGDVLCTLLESLSKTPAELNVAGYCTSDGSAVVVTTCGSGTKTPIPIVQLNVSSCRFGLHAYCSACLPYIEPRATSLPYAFMVISSLKDIFLILVGAYFLSKVWFRRPVTMCLTRMLLAITPLNTREKRKYADVLMARFNPIVIPPGQLYDICDELLIRDDTRRREYMRRKTGGALAFDGEAEGGGGPTSPGGTTPLGNSQREGAASSTASVSHRSWREELTFDNFLRTIGLRKSNAKDMSLNADDPTSNPSPQPGGGGNPHVVSSSAVTSRRSNLSEPLLKDMAGVMLDRDHPMEQHSSTLFSEEGVLVDDNVDSEVLQHFYRYYREAVCEHSRRQIGNTDHPLVRQRFQRLFEVYTEMFQKSQFGRERLMSNVFLDIDEEELDVDASQNFYSSFVVTSRSRMPPSSAGMSRAAFGTSSAASSTNLARQRSESSYKKPFSRPFSSVPPSTTRRSAIMNQESDYLDEMISPRSRQATNTLGQEMVSIQPVASTQEVRILEALEEELQSAKEELFDVCEMVPILLVPTMVDARFTPQAWMLFVEAFYCMLYFLVCVYQSSTTPGYHAWQIYSAVYFRYVNSCASVGLVVNALLRRVYLDEALLATDPFIVMALLLIGPAIGTHIIPGIVLYGWIHISVLLVWLPCCWIMRQLEKRFFYTLDPVSILFRVCFRLGTTIVATLLLQSSFNWALLYYEKHDKLGYLGIVRYEYASRTWSCLIESRLQSLANIVQFLSAFV